MQTLVTMDDKAIRYLRKLERQFPKEFRRAMRSGAYFLRLRMQAAMRSGGTTVNRHWDDLSIIQMQQQLEKLRESWKWGVALSTQGRWKKKLKDMESPGLAQHMKYAGGLRSGGRKRGATSMARLIGAVRYKLTPDNTLHLGFLDGSAAAHAKAVQEGKRGTPYRFEHGRSQRVTPAMRRMFWAAGIPISKSTRVLRQQPRPLVKPVFDKHMGEFFDLVENRLAAYVRGLSGSAASDYVRRLGSGL